MYVSLHSYGQKIMYPWSNSPEKVKDWRDLDRVGRVMKQAIKESSRGKYLYKVGTSPEINYVMKGSSDDWMRGHLGVKWVYLIELPSSFTFPGFLLPESEIVPTGKSVFHGIRAAALEVKKTL